MEKTKVMYIHKKERRPVFDTVSFHPICTKKMRLELKLAAPTNAHISINSYQYAGRSKTLCWGIRVIVLFTMQLSTIPLSRVIEYHRDVLLFEASIESGSVNSSGEFEKVVSIVELDFVIAAS